MSLEVVWQQRVNDDGGLLSLTFVPPSQWTVWTYIHIQCAWKGPKVDVYFVYLLSFMMGRIMDFYSNCGPEIVL